MVSGQTVGRIQQPVRTKLENYYDRITVPFLERIETAAQGRAVVLKTHGPVLPEVADWIAQGRIKASVSIRDPREMALSMADNGARARQLGVVPFSEIVVPTDALPSIDVQVNIFAQWAAVPSVEIFAYNEVCFATEQTIQRLCQQIGVQVKADTVLQPFRSGRLIGQINRAVPSRYTEMSLAMQDIFLQRYAEFYATTDLKEHLAQQAQSIIRGERGIFSHHLGNGLRLMRRLLLTRNLGFIVPDQP